LIQDQVAFETELTSIENRVDEEIERAIAFAEQSKDVQPNDYLPYITLEVDHEVA